MIQAIPFESEQLIELKFTKAMKLSDKFRNKVTIRRPITFIDPKEKGNEVYIITCHEKAVESEVREFLNQPDLRFKKVK